jgi:hypothetical protein
MDDLTDTGTHTKSQGSDKRQTRHNFVKISGKSIHFVFMVVMICM